MKNDKRTADESTDTSARAARWISQGFEDLLAGMHRARKRLPEQAYDYDVVIVGSGYGGAMAAVALAGRLDSVTGKPVRLCVLERGTEYLAGMFPVSEAELPGHVRFSTANASAARGRLTGLFDMRIGSDVCALVANGLGGGSLINAGVMLRPCKEVLESDSWPATLRPQGALEPYFDKAESLLAATGGRLGKYGGAGTVPLKFQALRTLGGNRFEAAPLSISIDGGPNGAGVDLNECIRCGDCASGCNHRAKNSLDQSCLVRARRAGAEIFTGATLLKLARLEGRAGWMLDIVHTDAVLRRRQGEPCKLTARRVILAAGTFGSTEILLRSQNERLRFSPRLGHRFSTNGDLLAAAYAQNECVNAVGCETMPFEQREIGPTITGMIDLRRDKGIAIQEFAIPGALRRLFAESFTLGATFHRLAHEPGGGHRRREGGRDPCAVDDQAIERTQVFGVMGHDGSAGVIELVPDAHGDGTVRVRWPDLREGHETTVFERQVSALQELVSESHQGGVVLPNPIWRLLPRELESLAGLPTGPALTVHPLGGCSMADSWETGVVDDCGRVFDASDASAEPLLHDGLVVLDGSIIPGSLGINPALTISAVALRALEKLAEQWQLLLPQAPAVTDVTRPPLFRHVEPARDVPTEIAITERLVGKLELGGWPGRKEPFVVELTLSFAPQPLRDLSRELTRKLAVAATSRLRVFDPDCWDELWRLGAPEWRFDERARFIAPVSGHMYLLSRGASGRRRRTLRAAYAWLRNRGARDLWQRYISERPGARGRKMSIANRWQALRSAWRAWRSVLSHAGEIRLFEYELEIGQADEAAVRGASNRSGMDLERLCGGRIRGVKELSYRRKSNPWRQLSEVMLTEFPALRPARRKPVLALEPKFYARQEKHLIQIVRQHDHATALFEMASFGLFIARLLLTTHFFSFRKPDTPAPIEPRRLPGKIPGLPEPRITEIDVDVTADGRAVRVRLTRYENQQGEPVVMIHGFSASGTTFAHPALQPSLAGYMWDQGWDVWVLDLRTSSGMPTCLDPWDFEQVARSDIPAAFDFIHRVTGRKVHVIAQCMGAAMFSMALLDASPAWGRWARERERLREIVGNVVLSQIGPMIVFTAANIFRAYAVNFVQHAVGDATFDLRPSQDLPGQILDRLLATVPYPDDEFDVENPRTPWKRTAFAGTRHRLDAWFGRVFNARNIDRRVLEHIDDMFGPINLRTTFQTIHFARRGMITTRRGRNAFISAESLKRWHGIATLSIHGSDNGLADIATVTRMRALAAAIGKTNYYSYVARGPAGSDCPGFGHQDCLIGRHAADYVFPVIERFLRAPQSCSSLAVAPPAQASTPAGAQSWLFKQIVDTPWLGPMVAAPAADGRRRIAVASNPKLGAPWTIAVVFVEPRADGQRYVPVETNRRILRIPIIDKLTAHDAGIPDGIEWYATDLDPSDFSGSGKVLVLLLYEQAPIVNLAWGDYPVDKEYSAGRQLPQWALRLFAQPVEDAVKEYLSETPAAQLECALQDRPPAPESLPEQLCFAVASCQYPAGPLDPPLAYASYQRLGTLLDGGTGEPRPQFVVLAGDQVYVDASAGLIDPTIADDRYELPYEKLLRVPAARAVLRRVPVYTMLDDHELEENWEPGAHESGAHESGASITSSRDASSPASQRHYGRSAYFKFQRAVGPVPTAAIGDSHDPVWYETELDGFRFFFADTRTERQPRLAHEIDNARIMSNAQFEALLAWLTRHRDDGRPMFVVSPAILLPRRLATTHSNAGAFSSDAWDGFPYSFRRLLAHIAHHRIENVTFLSGDEHHSCDATIQLAPFANESPCSTAAWVTIRSIHSSALYAPFTFANSRPEDLAGQETFDFDDPAPPAGGAVRYRCQVATHFAPAGDGFAVITCDANDAAWKARAIFYKAEARISS